MEILDLAILHTKFNYFMFSVLFVIFNGQDFWSSFQFGLTSFICECVRLDFFELCMSESWPKEDWFLSLPFASDIFFFSFYVIERLLFRSSVDFLCQMWFSTMLSIICINVFQMRFKIDPKQDKEKLDVLNEAASILIADVSFPETFASLVGAHIDVIFFWIFFCIKMFMFSGIYTGLIASFFFFIFSCTSFAVSISAKVELMRKEHSSINALMKKDDDGDLNDDN